MANGWVEAFLMYIMGGWDYMYGWIQGLFIDGCRNGWTRYSNGKVV